MSLELHAAVNVLIKALKEDADYYQSWKANIAMQFQDECARKEKGGVYNWHEISNTAADNFLQLLTK